MDNAHNINIAELAKARFTQLESYKDFDLEEKQGELDKAKKALDKTQKSHDTLLAEINGYKVFLGLPIDGGNVIGDEELTEKVKAVMPTLPDGPNGSQIAAAINLRNVTAQEVSNLYWKENQTVLKRTGSGLKTRYYLATPADLVSINASKDQEKAKAKAAKAKREADKAKLAALATAPTVAGV